MKNNRGSYMMKIIMWNLGIMVGCLSSPFSQVIAQNQDSNLKKENKTKKRPVIVQEVTVDQSEEMTMLNVIFNQATQQKMDVEVQNHGTFLQVSFADILAAHPGTFYDGSKPYIKKTALFQTSDKDSAIRLFLNQDGHHVIKGIQTEAFSDRIIISLDHALVSASLDETKIKKAPVDENTKAIAKPQQKEPKLSSETTSLLKANINPPVVSQQKTTDSEKKALDDGLKALRISEKPLPTLNGYLTKLAILSIVLILVLTSLIIAQSYRRKMLKKEGIADIPLRRLGSLSLAAKQQLSLIQVGSETLLLSVSPDQVNLIKQIPKDSHNLDPLSPDNEPQKAPLRVRPQEKIDQEYKNQKSLEPSHDKPRIQQRSSSLKRSSESRVSQAKEQKGGVIDNDEMKDAYQVKLSSEKETRQESVSSSNSEEKGESKDFEKHDKQTIEDVTALIREKLKTLPRIHG